MSAIGRYIVRTSFGAFVMVLVTLTTVVWITQALRDIDIVTNQGQTVLTFIGLALLLIPFLVLVVAPLSLMVAVAYTLNKLNTDSEIVVMNASGMSPWRIFLPFLFVAAIVSLMVGVISAYVAPKCLRELRTQLTKVRADLVANFIQPGRFTSVDGQRLTFHVRERRADGELVGIFIDDRRDPNERGTFLAERGRVLENDSGTFLVLEVGSAQRLQARERDPAIVQFTRYAFDLSTFTGSEVVPTFNMKERYLWELAWPDPNDRYLRERPGLVWSELNERLLSPIYPFIFVVIGFAILGAPRTSRQSRGLSMLMTVVAVTVVRLTGFAAVVASAKTPGAVTLLYGLLGVTVAGGLIMIARGTIIEPPQTLLTWLNALQERLIRSAPRPAGAPA